MRSSTENLNMYYLNIKNITGHMCFFIYNLKR